jgi:uncharacterized membrane protein YeaQ/YmgE (transglycosylase-associated protein family)
MGFILWLIMGGVVGWLASIIVGTDARQGIILNVAVGIFGAFIGGGLIVPLLGVDPLNSGITAMNFIVSLLGAVLLLALLRLYQRSYTP